MGDGDRHVQTRVPRSGGHSGAGGAWLRALMPGVPELSRAHEPSFWRSSRFSAAGGMAVGSHKQWSGRGEQTGVP